MSAVEDQIEYDLDEDLLSAEEEAAVEVTRLAHGAKRRASVSAEVYDPAKAIAAPIPKHPKSPHELEKLVKAAQEVLVFKVLDNDALKQVIDAVRKEDVLRGQEVVVQGASAEDAKSFYIVESGVFEAIVRDSTGEVKRVATYDNRGSFGELALMYNQPRAATVRAVTDGKVWCLDRSTFRQLVLGAAYKKREEYVKLLSKVDFFTELRSYERHNLCDALVPRIFKAGEKIINQGEIADGMYFVESGEVTVTAMQDGVQKEIGKIGPSGYFGELALITHRPRAATVAASSKFPETKLAFLDKQAFERLLGPCQNIMKRNMDKYEAQMNTAFGHSGSHGGS